MTVAALDVNAPYPQEWYSSEGPTNGPGGTAAGGAIKPDIAGFANVSTVSYPDPNVKFSGTSSSTPHVAGAAALVKGAFPAYTPAQIQDFLQGRAVDMGSPGKDTIYGYGRLNLGSAPEPGDGTSTPTPTPTATETPTETPTATPTPTPTSTPATGDIAGTVWLDADGDGRHDAGEAGVASAQIELIQDGMLKDTDTTSGDGTYRFSALAPDAYLVREVQPDWLRFSTTLDEVAVTLAAGETRTIDFGDWNGRQTYLPLLLR